MAETLMMNGAMPYGGRLHMRTGLALKAAAAFCFAVMVAGQAIFATYIVAFYGGAVAAGDWMRWNKVLPVGYVPGDRVGNTALAAHLAIAALVTLAGPLQLVPALRTRFPAFHRWNGRIYVAVAIVTALAGTYMVWTRNAAGDMTQHWGTTLNAMLIALCAVMAVRHAIARRLDLHRRWALRLFLVVSGSWFFRVGLLFWILVNGGPVGFDPKTFTGAALNVLVFGESLLPLALLELYLRARDGGGPTQRLAAAAALTLLTLAIGVGIVGASLAMWLPHIS